MSPVTRMRIGLDESLNDSTTSCCSTSERPPWRTATCSGLRPRWVWSSRCSQRRVGTRSEKTTARISDDLETPMPWRYSTSFWIFAEGPLALAWARVRSRSRASRSRCWHRCAPRRGCGCGCERTPPGREGWRGRPSRASTGRGPCSRPSTGSCPMPVEPDVRELVGDGILVRRCVHEEVLEFLALDPLVAHLAGDLGRMAVAAHDQPVERGAIDVAVGADRGRFEQADKLGEGLLAAVVGRRRRKDQRLGVRASTRARALFWVPEPVRL